METQSELVAVEKKGVRFATGTGEHESLHELGSSPRLQDDELAQIVHDLKNPLASIAIEAELLDSRIARGDRRETAKSIDRITQNVMFLDRLIYDLMDACTLANGEFNLRRTRFDLRQMIEAVVDRIVPWPDRHRVFADVDEHVAVVGDELRIERVIGNLLDNALKYSPASAAIVVSLQRDVQRMARVTVTDAAPVCRPASSRSSSSRTAARRRRPGATDRARPIREQADRRGARWSHRGAEHAGQGLAVLVPVADCVSAEARTKMVT